jgi:N-methylhydantoinase A
MRSETMGYMIGVDVGGTFTDFTVFDLTDGKLYHFKQSSTPDDPSRSIVSGIKRSMEELGLTGDEIVYLAHGTTVATNALIERNIAPTGLITTEGFKDLMEIGSQRRPGLYDLLKPKPENILAEGMKREVPERVLSDGSIEKHLDEDAVRREAVRFLEHGITAVAVCTLFSFMNPKHERRIREIILEECPDAYVSISSDLVSEFREYSRMSTTVLNACLGPVMKNYVENFQRSVKDSGIRATPYITQSNGSIISIAETIDCPIRTAVSGPSAGVTGALAASRQCGLNRIITFDMGGTSADISLIENGRAQVSYERLVEGYPARIPMIDIITVGAGGGSIAEIDEGGALKVGPRSAGASPGPACYMRGGTKPTVTDANILLGRLNRERILGGRMEVDISLAERAVREHICQSSGLSLEDAAAGIVSVVNSNMIRAIRVVSVERGYDPREFTLMAFGGAGPLHACDVASELGMNQVLIPPSPGTLCSLGLLMADTKFDLSRSRIMTAEKENLVVINEMNEIFAALREEGNSRLKSQDIPPNARRYAYSIDCRYERQNYEITVGFEMPPSGNADARTLEAVRASFDSEHERLYGYSDSGRKLQLVNFRVSAIGEIGHPNIKATVREGSEKLCPIGSRSVRFDGRPGTVDTKIYRREDIAAGSRLEGPAIVEQMDSTSVIPPGWSASGDEYGNIIVKKIRRDWE